MLSESVRDDVENTLNDQCAWYGLSFLIDTTMGLFLAILCLKALDHFAHVYHWTHLQESGVYVGPDGWKHWISQVFAWIAILTVTKIIIYFFMWAFFDVLAHIGQFLFEPLQGNIRFELVFVMILFPGVLNVIYFWIADSYLKAQEAHEGVHETASLEDMGMLHPTGDKKEHLLHQGDGGELETTTTTTPSIRVTDKPQHNSTTTPPTLV
jgi:hypothetical protein